MVVAKGPTADQLGVTNWGLFDGPVTAEMIYETLLDRIATVRKYEPRSLAELSVKECMAELGIALIECYEVDDDDQITDDDHLFAILTGV